VLPEPVMDRQVAGQLAIAFLGILQRPPLDPFPAEGLNVDAVGRRPYRSALPLGLGV
jgi:hypothetical protein